MGDSVVANYVVNYGGCLELGREGGLAFGVK